MDTWIYCLAEYRTGDQWLVPARTMTGGGVQLPRDGSEASLNPQLLPPPGEDHAYAGLSDVGPGPVGAQPTVYTDLRKFFDPLAI